MVRQKPADELKEMEIAVVADGPWLMRLEAEVVCDAHLALTQDLGLETVLETLLDYLRKLVPYDSACVMLAERDSRFVVSAMRGFESFLPDVALAKANAFDANTNVLFGKIC